MTRTEEYYLPADPRHYPSPPTWSDLGTALFLLIVLLYMLSLWTC